MSAITNYDPIYVYLFQFDLMIYLCLSNIYLTREYLKK